MNDRTIESAKREAKAIAREDGIPHSRALDMLAADAGFSHWGAYQARLRTADDGLDLDDERLGRFVSPADLMRKVAPDVAIADPDLLKARHVIVCGATASGKTVFLQKLLDAAPRRSPIVVLDMMRELRNPNPLWEVPETASRQEKFGRVVTHEVFQGYGTDADRMPWQWSRDQAGIVAFDEISSRSISAILHAMQHDKGGPSVFTTMSAHGARRLREVLDDMRSEYGGDHPDEPVMCVRMDRDERGRRGVKEIFAL